MSRVNNVAEQRASIIAATIRALTRDGLAETTTRKIAAEANVNQATLRYYFGAKDDLLFAVLQEMMQITRQIVQTSLPVDEDLHTAIAMGLKAFWAHVEEAPELQVIQYELTMYALRNPQSAWLAREQYDGYFSVIEALFQRYLEAAGKTSALPLADVARFVVGGIDGLILQYVSNPDPVRARKSLDSLILATISLMEGSNLPDARILA
ncbi:MAG: TetR/AcrR family transcriptional regulator [Ktedonobacteraceae bacterium]|nr:TetR/AcrR family transcriptional regulator [Ktedonobacteraceae bacterium]